MTIFGHRQSVADGVVTGWYESVIIEGKLIVFLGGQLKHELWKVVSGVDRLDEAFFDGDSGPVSIGSGIGGSCNLKVEVKVKFSKMLSNCWCESESQNSRIIQAEHVIKVIIIIWLLYPSIDSPALITAKILISCLRDGIG